MKLSLAVLVLSVSALTASIATSTAVGAARCTTDNDCANHSCAPDRHPFCYNELNGRAIKNPTCGCRD